MPKEEFQLPSRMELEGRGRRIADVMHRRRDRLTAYCCRWPVIRHGASRCADQMCVAIDEARHHDTPGGIDLLRRPCTSQVFHAARRPYVGNHPIYDQNGAILDESYGAQSFASARSRWSMESEKLSCSAYKYAAFHATRSDYMYRTDI